MQRWSFLFLFSCLLTVVLPFPGFSQSQDRLAAFIYTQKGNQSGLRTGALSNWILRQILKKHSKQKGVPFIERGMYFSRSQALSAKRRLKQAQTISQEAYISFRTNPEMSKAKLFRAVNFYKFSFKYYLDHAGYRMALFHLGLLLTRGGSYARAIQTIEQAFLLDVDGPMPSQINSKERRMLNAIRCRLGQGKLAKMTIKGTSAQSEIYLNGLLVGFGEYTIKNLPPGHYFVRTIQDGTRHWGRKIRLLRGANKTVQARNRFSPRANVYKDLCGKLGSLRASESAKMKIALKNTAYNMKVSRLLAGCFKQSGKTTGKLKWYALNGDNFAQGQLSIPSSFERKAAILSKLVKVVGFTPTTPPSLSLRQYKPLKTYGRCKDPRKIAEEARVEPKNTVRQVQTPWTPSVGDMIVIYTRFGFRIQGKVLTIKGPLLSLRVARKKSDPSALQKIEINHTQARITLILGPRQNSGYRIGESLIVMTRIGLQVRGKLSAEETKGLKIRTKQGSELIPWSMISRVVRHDR